MDWQQCQLWLFPTHQFTEILDTNLPVEIYVATNTNWLKVCPDISSWSFNRLWWYLITYSDRFRLLSELCLMAVSHMCQYLPTRPNFIPFHAERNLPPEIKFISRTRMCLCWNIFVKLPQIIICVQENWDEHQKVQTLRLNDK